MNENTENTVVAGGEKKKKSSPNCLVVVSITAVWPSGNVPESRREHFSSLLGQFCELPKVLNGCSASVKPIKDGARIGLSETGGSFSFWAVAFKLDKVISSEVIDRCRIESVANKGDDYQIVAVSVKEGSLPGRWILDILGDRISWKILEPLAVERKKLPKAFTSAVTVMASPTSDLAYLYYPSPRSDLALITRPAPTSMPVGNGRLPSLDSIRDRSRTREGRGKTKVLSLEREEGNLLDVCADLHDEKDRGQLTNGRLAKNHGCCINTMLNYLALEDLFSAFSCFLEFKTRPRHRLGLLYAAALAKEEENVQKAIFLALQKVVRNRQVGVLRQVIRIIWPSAVPPGGLSSSNSAIRRDVKEAKKLVAEIFSHEASDAEQEVGAVAEVPGD